MSNKIRFPDPYEPNIKRVEALIGQTDRVLDVGGWWKPFNRANVIVDLMPYESRGGGGHIGSFSEQFDADNWVQTDICEGALPFPDNAFDFVYCGQTLEDVRDPIALAAELSRVGRRGYIEVPSLWIECNYDIDALPNTESYPGYEKHRWIVDERDGVLQFIPKLSWMSLYRFVDKELFEAHRHRQEMWTLPYFWEHKIEAREWSFVGQEEIVPYLRERTGKISDSLRGMGA